MALPRVDDGTPDDVDQTISRTIEALMAYRRLTQAEVAKAAGLTQPQLSRRLHGHAPFKASEVAAIAVRLGVTVGDLYAGLRSAYGYNPDFAVIAGQPGEQMELHYEESPFRPLAVAV